MRWLRARCRICAQSVVQRDFQDRLESDDFDFAYRYGRRSTPLKAKVTLLLRCFDFFGKTLFLWNIVQQKMDGRCDLLHLILYLEKHFDLTSARFTLQSSKFAFLKQFLVPMFFAKPSPVSERRPSLSLRLSNNSNQ
jgi:hypothetical protein